MILLRRLFGIWPDGIVSLDRPRWLTAVVALMVLIPCGLGAAIGFSADEGWTGVPLGAAFGAAGLLVYRMELGLYTTKDTTQLKIRLPTPGRVVTIELDQIVSIGLGEANVGQGVLAVELRDGRRVAMVSTQYRPGAKDYYARLADLVDPAGSIPRSDRLGWFGFLGLPKQAP